MIHSVNVTKDNLHLWRLVMFSVLKVKLKVDLKWFNKTVSSLNSMNICDKHFNIEQNNHDDQFGCCLEALTSYV